MTEETFKMSSKWIYRRLPYIIRRRTTPQQAPFIIVALLAFVVLLLQLLNLSFGHPKKTPNRRPLAGHVMGVDSGMQHHYVPDQSGQFTCLLSGIKVNFDLVNDDYCDCPQDGSDEPATGACAKSVFHCTTHGQISASKVNDGICDCCDGSDEWKQVQPMISVLDKSLQKKLGRYLTPCPNVCT